MKQDVSKIKARSIKILTWMFILSLSFSISSVQGSIFKQENYKTHLRWIISTDKDQFKIQRSGTKLYIKTLNVDLWEKFKADLDKLSLNQRYIKDISSDIDLGGGNGLQVELLGTHVEVFDFYKDAENVLVIDFWSNDKEAKPVVTQAIPKIDVSAAKKSLVKKGITPIKNETAENVTAKVTRISEQGEYRDFRYGAPFIWDHQLAIPRIQKSVDYSRKTPEFFYPIKDREVDKNEIETHIQLSINLFRKKDWGLMNKSINLFKTKFGEDVYTQYQDINEYLKANAILRENINRGDEGPVKMAMAMLSNIADRTKDYELQKSIMKYAISFYMDIEDHVRALKEAKRLYVSSKDNFDIEESVVALDEIMYNLARLKQIDKIDDLMKDKIVGKTMPPQKVLTYRIYALVSRGELDSAIKLYDDSKSSIQGEIDSTLIYNVAEALFRKGQYEKAAELFDKYIANWSEVSMSAFARVRLALCYELLSRDPKKVENLYLNAINMSTVPTATVESKIRYVAMKTIRKFKPDVADLETRIFLDDKEMVKQSKDLKQLLWLVRLRSFIVDGKYSEGLDYLSVIPVAAMNPTDARVFTADGAELVYGMIKDDFSNSKYPHVIKNWVKYKDVYLKKIATDPLLNFAVSKSYIEMGLMDSFDKHISELQRYEDVPVKAYPLWVGRGSFNLGELKDVYTELEIIRTLGANNLDKVQKLLDGANGKGGPQEMDDYYRAILSYKKNDYVDAIKYFEKLLASGKAEKIVDQKSVADMLRAYSESLYKTNNLERYVEVGVAILQDSSSYKTRTPYFLSVEERIAYNIVEIVSSNDELKKKNNFVEMVESFIKKYSDSIHIGRAKLLLGGHYIKNNNESVGASLLESLVGDKAVSDQVKELARSELSLLKIKNRIL